MGARACIGCMRSTPPSGCRLPAAGFPLPASSRRGGERTRRRSLHPDGRRSERRKQCHVRRFGFIRVHGIHFASALTDPMYLLLCWQIMRGGVLVCTVQIYLLGGEQRAAQYMVEFLRGQVCRFIL